MLDAQMLDMIMLLSILGMSLVLFAMDKYPIDGIAFMVLLSLMLTGLVPEDKILAGFSNPATLTVAAMFILSAALQKTGVVRWLAQKLYKTLGRTASLFRVNLLLGSLTGFFSAFINNTATVSVLIPVTLRICQEQQHSPTRVLMMLSYAAQFGGMCTLIGTTTNLLINAYALDAGLPGFGLFEFGQLGLILFAAGMVYMLVASYWLLPARIDATDINTSYKLHDYLTEMRVLAGSPLIGCTGQANPLLEAVPNLSIVQILRNNQPIWAPASTKILADDVLVMRGAIDRVMDVAASMKLKDWANSQLDASHLQSDDIILAEFMVPGGSYLVGRSLTQLDFYWRYHAAVIGIKRRNEILKDRLSDILFQDGDILLLQGHRSDIMALAQEPDFIMVQDLSDSRIQTRRARLALMWMAIFLLSVGLGYLSVLQAAFLATAGVVATRCIKLGDAYHAIHMPVVILMAALIPLGFAMQETGTAAWIAQILVTQVGPDSPILGLAAFYGLTVLLSAIMSNTATAALLAPLAIGVASDLGVSAIPFLVAVAFAASSSFITPVGYQTNMMIHAPGGYKYTDFLRIGLPLNMLFMAISVIFIPRIWPF